MKPKAIFKRTDRGPCWFLLYWTNSDGLSLVSPTLGTLIDAARKENTQGGISCQ